MPRGVPKAGFRKTNNQKSLKEALARKEGFRVPGTSAPEEKIEEFSEPVIQETDEEIAKRIDERFEMLAELARAQTQGNVKSIVVSGHAGFGKSYTIEKVLQTWNPSGTKYEIVKGLVKATGLLRLLYKHRANDHVLVLDDADTVFYDETSLNMIKAATDTTKRRMVSYRAEVQMVDEDSGDIIPRTFEFEGSIVFISNLDFDKLIAKDHKFAPHLRALTDRAYYVDTTIRSRRDCVVRMKQVVAGGMLGHYTKEIREDTLKFVIDHQDNLRNLSLRSLVQVAQIRALGHAKWEALAKVTCCKSN
jgi:hypothetical protein